MLVFFLLVTLVSVAVLTTSFFVITTGIIRDNSRRLLVDLIRQIASDTDDLFAEARETLDMVANDPKIQQVLRAPLPRPVSARYSQELEVDNQLSFVQSYRKDLFGIYVIGANGAAFKSNFFSGREGDWTGSPWYARILASQGPLWLAPHPGAFTVRTVDQPIITCGLSITDKASGRSLGVALVDVEVRTIEGLLRGYLDGRGSIGVVDAEGAVLCGVQGFAPGGELARGVGSPARPPERQPAAGSRGPGPGGYLTYARPLAAGGWSMVGAIPQRELTRDMAAITTLIVALFTAICAVDVLAALYFTARLTRPLSRLEELMKRVETGDFGVTMDTGSRDEIGRLAESFNVMVHRLDTLMRQLYANQQKLRRTQLAALQAQINPHFLYNTLDSVCWLAREEKKAEIISTVTALTKLLRIGLSRGDEVISVREEVEHARNYLIIQKMRYGGILDFAIDVPDDLGDFRMVKLTLQPLVENALYHGIKTSGQHGLITIRAARREAAIEFRVSDTGIGMSSEKLQGIEAVLADPEGRSEGVGLKNVHDRLRICFPESGGLAFESRQGEGTTVSFRIPATTGR